MELLQLRILDQLRLVVANQKAIIWISVSLPIVFTPKQTGILMNQSRVVVKVDPFNSYRGFHQAPSIDVPEETEKHIKFNNIGIINDGMLRKYVNVPKQLVLRVIPVDSDGKRNLIHPYTVFIHEDLVDDKCKNGNNVLATMRSIPTVVDRHSQENVDNDCNDIMNNPLCVEIIPIDHIVFKSLCREDYNTNIPSVLIPKSLNSIINIDNGVKVVLTIIGDNISQPEHIHINIYSDTQNESDVMEKFKTCVIENTHSGKKFLINNDMVKQNTEICDGFLQFKLKPEKLKYTLLNSESFRHCTISAKCLNMEVPRNKPVQFHSELEFNSHCRSMKTVENLLQKVVSHINFEIHREACFKGASEIKSNILVTGNYINF